MLRIASFFLLLFITQNVYSQNVEREIALGDEANEQIIAQIGLYDHPSQSYLNTIGQDLIKHLSYPLFDYTFTILDMKDPNAMALPGGYVYFSRGILALVNSEDELAGVMGHEITHVYKLHSRKARNRSIFTTILQVPGALIGIFAPGAGAAINNPIAAGGELFNSGYSRSNEKEADKEGAKLVSISGYDPNGLPILLSKISAEVEMETGEAEKATWLDSHPYTPDRVEDLDKTIAKLDYAKANPSDEEHKRFIQTFEGICIGQNPRNGIFQDGKFIHPDLGFTFSYPSKWQSINTPSVVGFISEDNSAQLLFTLSDSLIDPTVLADDFMKSYYKSYKTKPSRNEALKINDSPAHILQFTQVVEDENIIASILWLTKGNRTYQFMLVSNEKISSLIIDTAKSLQPIKEEERNSIYQTLLHVVQAKEGETFEELSKRTDNEFDLDYTLLINNASKEEVLSSSKWVKIGIKKKY